MSMRESHFIYDGVFYIVHSRLVDTDWGPENQVQVFNHLTGKQVWSGQEAMSTAGMISMCKEYLDFLKKELSL